MSTPFAIALVAGLISVCSADAAFELDALEIWLPFAGPDGAAGNPAAATALPCPRWTLQYHLPFGLHELRYNSLSMTLPQGKFRLNAGLASTGFSLHRERSAWLGGRLALGPNLELGAAIAILHLQQEKRTQGNRAQRLGLGLKIAPNLEMGLRHHSSGPFSPSRVYFILILRPDAQNLLYAHLRHHPAKSPRLDLAAEHQLHPRIRLGLGTRAMPRRFALGTRIGTSKWKIAYAIKTHEHLGPSHTFALGNTCRSP